MDIKVVSPKDYSKVDESTVRELCKQIDEQLIKHGNGEWYRDHTFAILFADKFTPRVREVIEAIYIKAGWPRFETKTSEENGERSGLISIKAYY